MILIVIQMVLIRRVAEDLKVLRWIPSRRLVQLLPNHRLNSSIWSLTLLELVLHIQSYLMELEVTIWDIILRVVPFWWAANLIC